MNNTSQNIVIYEFIQYIFYLFIFSIPFSPVLNLEIYDFKIFNGAIGIGAFITYLIAVLFCLIKIKSNLNFHYYNLFYILIILILIFKFSVSGMNGNIFKIIQPYFLSIIFFLLGYSYIKNAKTKKIFLNIFIIMISLLAILGIIHYHLFSDLVLINLKTFKQFGKYINIHDIENMRYRESFTIPSPVGYGHTLTFGAIFLINCKNKIYKWFLVLIILYAVILSGSRVNLYFLSIYILLTSFSLINIKKFLGVILIFLFIIYFASTYTSFNPLNLYKTGIELRLLKFIVLYTYLSKDILVFLFGVPLDIYPSMMFGSNRISVGDNTYIFMMSQIGFIGFVIYLFIIKNVYSRFKKIRNYYTDIDLFNYIKAVYHCAIAYVIFGGVHSINYQYPQMLFIAIFIGSIFNVNSYQHDKKILFNH